jgi:hypothetical protein
MVEKREVAREREGKNREGQKRGGKQAKRRKRVLVSLRERARIFDRLFCSKRLPRWNRINELSALV